jgi:ATP-binding protein involved in chromosome partitioning
MSQPRIARQTVLVAGGKGGVGKSTVAATLARQAQVRVPTGLLDADLAGPSVPHLFNRFTKPQVRNGRIVPPEAFGVRLMSVGLLTPSDKPITWTGPLIRGALWQMLFEVDWGQPEILVIDSPPGTGEVHLALVRLAPISAVVLVSEDDELAMADARRADEFYRRCGLPVVGTVINRSDPVPRTDLDVATRGERVTVPYLPAMSPVERVDAIGDSLTPVLDRLSI